MFIILKKSGPGNPPFSCKIYMSRFISKPFKVSPLLDEKKAFRNSKEIPYIYLCQVNIQLQCKAYAKTVK